MSKPQDEVEETPEYMTVGELRPGMICNEAGLDSPVCQLLRCVEPGELLATTGGAWLSKSIRRNLWYAHRVDTHFSFVLCVDAMWDNRAKFFFRDGPILQGAAL